MIKASPPGGHGQPMVTLPGGEAIPALGLGTWQMGERSARRADEVRAIRTAIELGLRLIDTAEMYGDGGAEEVLGEALAADPAGRASLFIVSKFYPQNASRRELPRACDRSRRRMGIDTIDLYLLHWPGGVPLDETVETLELLQASGRIRHWGVSNFDVDEMQALRAVDGGDRCAINQVHYSPSTRGIEFDLLPWQRRHQLPTMAYSPIDQGELARHPALAAIGARHQATAAQVALAWLRTHDDVVAIPKAVTPAHLADIAASRALTLDAADLAALDAAFPPPRRKTRLHVL